MTCTTDPLEPATFHGSDVEGLPYPAIRATLATCGVARVRGVFDRETMRNLLAGMQERFDAGQDQRHDPRDSDAPRRNFQKLQVGANSGVDSRRTLGRFMRVLYNPIFAEDVYGMREHFVRLAQMRNLLSGLPPGFAVHQTEDGLWACSRIQQYPRGGGFMVPHRDMYSQVASTDSGLGYFQLLLLLSERGRDFQQGGAYVETDQERILYEEGCRSGDVVVYDGRTRHGVADIDPMEPLELQRFGGRVVGIVSLFRLLRPGGEDYAAMARRARQTLGPDEPER